AILRGEPPPGIPIGPAPATSTATVDTAVIAMGAGRGPFAGREEELGALDAALARVTAGGTGLVVVEGEAGIGKTALLDAWAPRAAARGATVVRGTCGEFERLLPLQSVADAIAVALRGQDAG